MPRDDDNLCYDSGLGWIDPSDPMGSLGVTVTECPGVIIYDIAARGHAPPIHLVIGRDWDFAVVRAVVDDAEMRIKGRISS